MSSVAAAILLCCSLKRTCMLCVAVRSSVCLTNRQTTVYRNLEIWFDEHIFWKGENKSLIIFVSLEYSLAFCWKQNMLVNKFVNKVDVGWWEWLADMFWLQTTVAWEALCLLTKWFHVPKIKIITQNVDWTRSTTGFSSSLWLDWLNLLWMIL